MLGSSTTAAAWIGAQLSGPLQRSTSAPAAITARTQSKFLLKHAKSSNDCPDCAVQGH